MPTLADIYSAADSFKRRLADAASNPSGSLQQMLGYANDRARNFNELQQQSLAETRQGGFANQGPATQALNQAYMEAGQVPAMVVYHGSPHVFEKFDLSKIGTGEGNQSYGHGMYMAQSPDVAERYRSTLTGYRPDIVKNKLIDKGISEELADTYSQFAANTKGSSSSFNDFEKSINQPSPSPYIEQFRSKLRQELPTLKEKIENISGAFYKVDLPDAHIRRMLDWDEPLKNQPAQVRKLAKQLNMDMNDLGGDLLAKVGKNEEGKQILEKAGIRGIKYLDEQSRGKTSGTRNFVVFDPNHLTILERNVKPIK